MAIVTYVLSDVLLVGAVVAWIWVDVVLGIFLGILAVLLTLSALRCAQVAFIRPQIEDSVDHRETILATLGARRHVRFSLFRHPLFVVLTDRHLYAWRVAFKVQEPDVRVAYNDVLGFGLGEGTKSFTLLIELPSQTLELVGTNWEDVSWAERVLNEKRPGAVRGTPAETLKHALDD